MSPQALSSTPRELTQAIKVEARRLGFQLVGVTTPDPPPHLQVYTRWLDEGHHAGMAWMAAERARERRAEPLKILPECKSILVLGIRYPAPPPYAGGPPQKNETGRGAGQIAAYAQGADYHEVLPERLRAMVKFIEGQIGGQVPNRWYTDTGPILERELAQRAGLGWIGKNSCLINPAIGSYCLLAEILLGMELEIDSPFTPDRCGTCTRCLDHCPTGCITPERTIDARRCISYLTIEHKGALPEDMRPQLGDWIFGCDVCQQVCPWNQRISRPRPSDRDAHPPEPAFEARPGLPPDSLAAELALTPQAFNRNFKGSPIKRSKRRGYLRNITVALGNNADHQAVPALVQALKDIEPLIRSHAAWALGRIGGAEALQALQRAGRLEKDPAVLAEIQAALESHPGVLPWDEPETGENSIPDRT